MSPSEQLDLIAKFDDIREEWKTSAISTIKNIHKTIDESESTVSETEASLVGQTTKLVIAGRTFAAQSSSSKPHGLDEEISRYLDFSFGEFVKCE